jgi:hypothetical protein
VINIKAIGIYINPVMVKNITENDLYSSDGTIGSENSDLDIE